MYQKILLALDTTDADLALLSHIELLAKVHKSKLVLLHVADGWAARHFDSLKLVESEEMKADRQYLERVAEDLRSKGMEVTTELALGDPPWEILKAADREQCDLIAMTSHGHRFIADIIYGSTIEAVRHRARVPLLIVRAQS